MQKLVLKEHWDDGTTGEAKTETHDVAEAGVSAEAKNGNGQFEAGTKVEVVVTATAGTSTNDC